MAALPALPSRRTPRWARVLQVLTAVRDLVGTECTVRPFGSAVTEFDDDDGDLDIAVLVPGVQPAEFLRELSLKIEHEAGGDFSVVAKALGAAVRVPVLTLSFNDKLKIDITINNTLAVFNTALLAAYRMHEPRLVPLVRAVKAWAKEQQIHGATPQVGFLSSYSWTLLVISYAQCCYRLLSLQADCEPEWWQDESGRWYDVAMRQGRRPTRRGGQQRRLLDLKGFARFLMNTRWDEQVFSIRQGNVVNMHECCRCLRPFGINIEDPLDETRNLGCTVNTQNYDRLRAAIAEAAA